MTGRTHYELLGVGQDATAEEIKAAFRKLARVLHPDQPSGSAALFGLTNDAYDVLRDPGRRAAYDRELAGPATSSSPPPPRPQPTPQPQSPPRAQQQAPGAGPSAGGSTPFANPAFGFGGAAPARSGPQPVAAGAAGKVPWWVAPATFAVILGLSLLRFTGATAALFGARRGSITFGGLWTAPPRLLAQGWAGVGSGVGLVAVISAAAVGAYWARKRYAPITRIETALLPIPLAVVALCGEFVLVTGTAWATLTALVAGYAVWLWVLGQLPKPVTEQEWSSFPDWVKGSWQRRDQVRFWPEWVPRRVVMMSAAKEGARTLRTLAIILGAIFGGLLLIGLVLTGIQTLAGPSL